MRCCGTGLGAPCQEQLCNVLIKIPRGYCSAQGSDRLPTEAITRPKRGTHPSGLAGPASGCPAAPSQSCAWQWTPGRSCCCHQSAHGSSPHPARAPCHICSADPLTQGLAPRCASSLALQAAAAAPDQALQADQAWVIGREWMSVSPGSSCHSRILVASVSEAAPQRLSH